MSERIGILVGPNPDPRSQAERLADAAALSAKWERERVERAEQKVRDEREAYRIKSKEDRAAAKRASERAEMDARIANRVKLDAASASRIRHAAMILADAGIRMKIDGCGCCGSPTVTMEYRGDLILDEEADACIDTGDLGCAE